MNNASIKVLKKNGFKIKGRHKSHIIYNAKRYESLTFGLVL